MPTGMNPARQRPSASVFTFRSSKTKSSRVPTGRLSENPTSAPAIGLPSSVRTTPPTVDARRTSRV